MHDAAKKNTSPVHAVRFNHGRPKAGSVSSCQESVVLAIGNRLVNWYLSVADDNC